MLVEESKGAWMFYDQSVVEKMFTAAFQVSFEFGSNSLETHFGEIKNTIKEEQRDEVRGSILFSQTGLKKTHIEGRKGSYTVQDRHTLFYCLTLCVLFLFWRQDTWRQKRRCTSKFVEKKEEDNWSQGIWETTNFGNERPCKCREKCE